MHCKNLIVLLLISTLWSQSLVSAFYAERGAYRNRLSLADTLANADGRTEYDISREQNGQQSSTYYQALSNMKPPSYLREDQKAEFYRRMQIILEKLDQYFQLKKVCLEQPENCQLDQYRLGNYQ